MKILALMGLLAVGQADNKHIGHGFIDKVETNKAQTISVIKQRLFSVNEDIRIIDSLFNKEGYHPGLVDANKTLYENKDILQGALIKLNPDERFND